MGNGTIDPLSGLEGSPLNKKIPTSKPSITSNDIKLFSELSNYANVFGSGRQDVGDYFETDSKYDLGITRSDLDDLNQERALQQPVGDKWVNGLTKFVGKTGTAVLGGTIGTVTGLPNLFREDRSVYDTGFQRWLDDMNEKMDEVLPNYATNLEKEEGFLKSLNNANFWANDVLSGLSFTAGAVLTELIWSGATAATLGAAAPGQAGATAGLVARGARYLKKYSRADDVTKGLARMKRAGQTDAALLVGRQMYTGAGYEAGVEARQHKKQLTDELKGEWFTANPEATEIPQDDLNTINDYVTRSANGVFAANVGVVGLSNMIALPKIFGPGAKSMKTPFSAIGKQFKEVEGAVKAVFAPAYKDASRLAKIAEAAYLTTKNPFVEGIWEEGMQGVANNTMLDYTTKKYNPDGTESVADLLESFGEGLKETYGGKEGWKEIGIGIIIGSIGSPNFNAYQRKDGKLARKKGQPVWTGGIAGEFQARNKKREEADRLAEQMNTVSTEDLIAFLNKNPELLKSTKALTEHNIRSATLNSEMDIAMEGGSVFDVKNIENDLIHSFITARIEGGYGADLIDEFTASVENMSDEDFASIFNYNKLTEQELSERKRTVVQNFKERVENTKEIMDLVDSNLKIDKTTESGKNIHDSLVYAGSVIRDTQKREDELAARITELTEVAYNPEERGESYQNDFRNEINRSLREDPTHKPEVKKLQSDIKKLQNRRHGYIKQYNYLFTEKGQEEYTALINEVQENLIETIKKQAVKDLADKKKAADKTAVSKGRVLNETEKKRLTDKINSFTDPEELTSFINDKIKPLDLDIIDDVRREAERVYRKLTGEKLDIKKPRYVDKVYSSKKDGKKYIVKKDNNKDDTYYLKEFKEKNTTKNVAVLTKEDLNRDFNFESSWENYKGKEGVEGTAPKPVNKDPLTPIEEVFPPENSGATVPTENKKESEKIWSGIKRHIDNVFRGLTGQHVEASGELTSDPNQRRYYRWTNNTDLTSKKYSIKIVKATDISAFEAEREQVEREGYKFEDTYYALVVDEDGNFVQEEGPATENFNRDLNIWTSFPLATLETKSFGNKYYTPQSKADWAKLYPSLTVEEAKKAFEVEKESLVKQHNALRKGIRERLESNQEVIFKLVDKGVGIPNDPFEDGTHLEITEVLGHDNVEIVVSTLGTTSFDNKSYANLPLGFTYLQDSKTGNRYEAKSRKLNEGEVSMVINMLRAFVNNSKLEENGNITSKDANQLTNADGTVIGNMFKVMSDLVFWTGNNLKKDSNNEYTLPMNTNDKTTFHFVKSDHPGGSIKIGEKDYQLFVVEDGNLVLNKEIADENGEGALKDFLENRYVNVNANKLEKNEKFLEFTSVDENGVAEFTTHSGYKSYLMGDGSGNHILGLSVAPVGSKVQVDNPTGTGVIEEDAPQMFNQYAIYEATEDYITEETTTIEENIPSVEYDNFEGLSEGSRLRVVAQKLDGEILFSGVIEIGEDLLLTVVEGTLSDTTVKNIGRILGNGSQAKEAFDDTNRQFRKKLQVEFKLADVTPPSKIESKVEKPKVEKKVEEVDTSDPSYLEGKTVFYKGKVYTVKEIGPIFQEESEDAGLREAESGEQGMSASGEQGMSAAEHAFITQGMSEEQLEEYEKEQDAKRPEVADTYMILEGVSAFGRFDQDR
jgi:hypothetical protein